MMQLKHVGDMPVVSKSGVTFDRMVPDKYSYLQAACELLEALSYGATETTKHLYKVKDKTASSDELFVELKKHIKHIDDLIIQRDKNALRIVDKLVERVESNNLLTPDERTAWLGNIDMMKEYFYQFVMNETAYEAALDALSDEIHEGKIQEVSVPMFKNYAMVLNDLVAVLESRKAPIDSEVKIEQKGDELIGTLYITHR